MMGYIYSRETDEERKRIAQGDDPVRPPHTTYEVVHSKASMTGYYWNVQQMGTRAWVARTNDPLDAVKAALKRAKAHAPHGRVFTRSDEAYEAAVEAGLVDVEVDR